jgi:hypothetical protein
MERAIPLTSIIERLFWDVKVNALKGIEMGYELSGLN